MTWIRMRHARASIKCQYSVVWTRKLCSNVFCGKKKLSYTFFPTIAHLFFTYNRKTPLFHWFEAKCAFYRHCLSKKNYFIRPSYLRAIWYMIHITNSILLQRKFHPYTDTQEHNLWRLSSMHMDTAGEKK